MPFYQVVCIAAHNRDFVHIQQLARQAAMHVMNNGGVVRGIRYWGLQTLPQRMRAQKQNYDYGDYWSMHFDASPQSHLGLRTMLRKDPRVIRATILKMGERIEDVAYRKEQTIHPVAGADHPRIP